MPLRAAAVKVKVRSMKVYNKSNSTITASVDEPFAIALEGNPTTGYEWLLHFDEDKVQVIDQKYQSGSKAIGASATSVFTLRPLKSGEVSIRAEYKRSWESKAIEEETFQVSIEE